MSNCIFYTLFFVLFLNVSFGSLKYSQVHRTYMAAYKGMYEACSITVDSNGEPTLPYFNSSKMQTYLDDYFKENLSKYVKDYSVSVKYYSFSPRQKLCKKNCQHLKVSLTAKINTFYSYSKSQIFSITDGDTL